MNQAGLAFILNQYEREEDSNPNRGIERHL